jgi:transcriptional regulator GlxA family with amidase domain
MNRRELLKRSAALGLAAGIPSLAAGKLFAGAGGLLVNSATDITKSVSNPLTPPAHGSIPVAFVLSEGAVVIDFCGPWEVFENVSVPGRTGDVVHLFTVAETINPIHTSGGMKIIPEYTFDTAPAPKVIVIPGQDGRSEAMMDWIRKSTKSTDVTMSVCVGAFVLASTGLLSGKAATTHHNSYRRFAMQFPDIQFKRGARFVEDGNLATSGGLSCGIDLALRVVERYFGREVASKTAYQLEYQGQGWMNQDSNNIYLKELVSTDAHPLCPVCKMEVDKSTSPQSVYQNRTYYFCMQEHKERFDAAPERFVRAVEGLKE